MDFKYPWLFEECVSTNGGGNSHIWSSACRTVCGRSEGSVRAAQNERLDRRCSACIQAGEPQVAAALSTPCIWKYINEGKLFEFFATSWMRLTHITICTVSSCQNIINPVNKGCNHPVLGLGIATDFLNQTDRARLNSFHFLNRFI